MKSNPITQKNTSPIKSVDSKSFNLILRRFLNLLYQFSQKMDGERNASRLRWTAKEEMILKDMFESKGITSWITISNFLNQNFDGPCRTPKQCRQRYHNFLKSGKEKVTQPWTEHQNQILFNLYCERGSKWVQIAKQMKGRSENTLKNKFYGELRKLINTINNICRSKKDPKIKPVKYITITKILERTRENSCTYYRNPKDDAQEKDRFCQKLRYDIIQISKNQQTLTKDLAIEICLSAHRFNSLNRFENMARNRNLKCNKKKNKRTLNRKITIQTSQQQIKKQQDQVKKPQSEEDKGLKKEQKNQSRAQSNSYMIFQSQSSDMSIQVQELVQDHLLQLSWNQQVMMGFEQIIQTRQTKDDWNEADNSRIQYINLEKHMKVNDGE